MLSEDMEKDIISLVHAALSNKKKYNPDLEATKELFITTLKMYSVLRQTPKFFVKLLLGVVEIVQNNKKGLKKGQIEPAVLQACAECINELPPGQTFELWEIFAETFSTLRKIVLSSPELYGALFYVCQLFQTFLLHARIFDATLPTNSLSKMETMVQLTNENLKEMSSILKETNSKVIPCQLCLLIICYAIGEVKIAQNVTIQNTPEFSVSNLEVQILDFSLLHPFLSDHVATVFSSYLESQDKSRIYYLIQILIQKIRVLMLNQNNKEEHLQLSIAFLIEIMTSLDCDANEAWNTDLSTLDVNNYGTALWGTFLKVLPVISSFLNNKQASSLCDTMTNVLLMTSERLNTQNEVDARTLICYFLKSEFFKESTILQTALISSVWKNCNIILKTKKRSHDDSSVGATPQEKVLNELNKFHYKWGKYASTIPKDKNGKGSNDFWYSLTETSAHLTHMLETSGMSKQSLNVLESENILKILDFLPLECLLPGNQMRCLVGLSVMFFSLPKNSKNPEVIHLAEHIGILLISIFEGVRSVWLFDFVDGGLYLKAVIETLDNFKMKLSDSNSDWVHKLLEHIIILIIRNPEILKSSEAYFVQLANNMSESLSTAKVMSILLHRLVLQLQRRYLTDIQKAVCKSTVLLVCSCTFKNLNRPDQINKDIYAVLISCYAELIELAITPNLSLNEKDCSKWFKILPNIIDAASQQILQKSESGEEMGTYLQLFRNLCSHHIKLSVHLPNDFIKLTWKTITSYLEKKCEQIKQKRSKESKDSSQITKFTLLRENPQLPFHSCPSYLEFDSKNFTEAKCIVTLNTSELDILSSISETASEDELKEIFESLQAKIEYSSSDINAIDPISFQMTLLVTRQLISSAEQDQLSYVSKFVPKILSLLHYITSQTCGSLNCLFLITIPVLQFVDFLLKKDKLVLPRQTKLQCLHSCVGINIENLTSEPAIFANLFIAIWDLLNDLVTHHHDLVVFSSASFVSFVSMLLKSVVKAGNQDVLKSHTNDVKQQIVSCAQNMDRLLTLISKYEVEFAKLAPYLVADYVDSVQHITVDPTVKDHLLLGVNRLLHLCNEHALKMISVNLNDCCREIYSNLVTNYKHYKHYV